VCPGWGTWPTAPWLAIGTIPFGHGRVTQTALDDYYTRERRLVAPITVPTVPLERR
jgi:hypothetical protein